jgi:hypothetical protein
LHERRHEEGADDAGVDEDGERGAEAEFLGDDDLRAEEGEEDDREEKGGGGHDPARAFETDGHGFRVGVAVVVGFLDPGEEEDAIVGGEAEDDREEQEQLGRFEATLAGVAEQALEPSVLEDEDEDALQSEGRLRDQKRPDGRDRSSV